MIYRQFLVHRSLLMWYTAAMLAASLAFMLLSAAHRSSRLELGTMDSMLFMQGWFVGLIATVYGSVFGSSLRQNARVWWTLPHARWNSAITIAATDIAGLCVAVMAGCVAFIAPMATLTGIEQVAAALSALSPGGVLLTFGFIASVYALSAVVGLLVRSFPWASIATIPVLTILTLAGNFSGPLGEAMRKLRVVNPQALYSSAILHGAVTLSFANIVALLWAIAAFALVALVLTWQRSDIVAT